VRFFRCQANGSIAWHADHGKLQQVHFHTVCSAKAYEVERVSACLYEESYAPQTVTSHV
jgi:hypothetical protein